MKMDITFYKNEKTQEEEAHIFEVTYDSGGYDRITKWEMYSELTDEWIRVDLEFEKNKQKHNCWKLTEANVIEKWQVMRDAEIEERSRSEMPDDAA